MILCSLSHYTIAMKLIKGVYENLIDESLRKDIVEASNNGLVCKEEDADTEEIPSMLSKHIYDLIRSRISDKRLSTEEKWSMINKIILDAGGCFSDLNVKDSVLLDPGQILTEVETKSQQAEFRITSKQGTERPLSGFRVSTLFTGSSDQNAPSMIEEIRRDIASADHIYFIVSFLKWSGVLLLLEPLRKFCSEEGHKLDIITTTYCGITEAKAVEELSKLPRTDIRISYNARIERLHAKSYIFERNSGLSTAYIGSSNLSHSAQTDGLEWNIRVTNVENPHIIKAAIATFDRYWQSENFEDYRLGGKEKFLEELKEQKSNKTIDLTVFQKYNLLPHQKSILDRLKTLREINGITRNLIVAATGTGKTVISAFDYQAFRNRNQGHSKLLFMAHREEILKQSLTTYRSVLGDHNFGDLWVGNYEPNNIDDLFVSVQTLNSRWEDIRNLGPKYYDYIVIDEAHHIEASSYRKIVEFFKPSLFIGLTATPERMDGQSLLPDFDNTISAEIRLPKALQEGLLTPFHYFCISDDTDLSANDLWANGKYKISALSNALCLQERLDLIIKKIYYYITDVNSCRALCFCADKAHAEFMAEGFKKANFKAEYLTSDCNNEKRVSLNEALKNGSVNFLFVVDIFNEGVDLPQVDTVLFLRPTESLTIFLQQLGRGLRLYPGKDYLTVLDFVANVNQNFDFTGKINALLIRKNSDIGKQVADGFSDLPSGCSIIMEQKAQEIILDNINKAIYNRRRLVNSIMNWGEQIPTIKEFLASISQDIRILYKGNSCWSALLKEAKKIDYEEDGFTKMFERNMGNFVHVNSLSYIEYVHAYLIDGDTSSSQIYKVMLYYALYGDSVKKIAGINNDVDKALAKFREYDVFRKELSEILDYLKGNLEFETQSFDSSIGLNRELELYGCYTREEAFTLLGVQTPEKRMQGSPAGVYSINDLNLDIFFVTLNKSDKDFSPSTQYEDYFISKKKFHWQSQNNENHTNRGARYVNQQTSGRRFLLFVRENKKDGFGNTCPYYCLGFLKYVSSTDDNPMSINWDMESEALPEFVKAI